MRGGIGGSQGRSAGRTDFKPVFRLPVTRGAHGEVHARGRQLMEEGRRSGPGGLPDLGFVVEQRRVPFRCRDQGLATLTDAPSPSRPVRTATMDKPSIKVISY